MKKVHVTLVILSFVLLFLFFLLWRQYLYFQRIQSIQAVRGQITQQLGQIAGLRKRGPLTAADASYIQSWMTFDYVDTTFGVPPTYIETTLDIHSLQYPHISLSRYARENNIDLNAFTAEVAGAVRTYLASSTASSSVPVSTSTSATAR